MPGKKKNKSKALTAKTADKYALYLKSVQSPDYEIDFFNRVFSKAYGRKPVLMREDFCGTAAVCAAWVRSGDRRAIGVDFDPEPLAWGEKHLRAKLPADRAKRMKLIEGDVREVGGPRADIVSAQNFATGYFYTREELLDYFKAARGHLKREGLLFLDCMGGSETYEDEEEEETEFKGFTYIWNNHNFDPITHRCTYFIHFEFPDGTRIDRAFRYDWRLWSIPEIRELLAEAGYRDSWVYWESTDLKTGEGNGVYRRRESAEADPAWVCYIIGVK
ncbi:MAG: hypothetical protein ACI8TX_002823 [Hyphomicrobiaceae bacterium]|jgi:hypothetical protein